jgi:transaldolase
VLQGVDEARALLDELRAAGVDYDDVTATLEVEGVQKFADSFEQIVESIRAKRGALQAA